MKIAVFHELHNGGARKYVNETSKRLSKNNQVDLYFVDEVSTPEEKVNFTNTYFFKFFSKNWKGNNWKIRLYKDSIELFKIFLLHRIIAKKIDAGKYDLVFVHPSKYTQAPFVLMFLKTSKIYYAHEALRMVYDPTLNPYPEKNLLKRIYEKINKSVRQRIDYKNIMKSDLILVNSKFTKNNIKKFYNLKSVVASPGVDTDLYRPKSHREIDLLFVGSMDYRSGYDLFSRATKDMYKDKRIVCHLVENNWISEGEFINKLLSNSKIVLCLKKNEPFGLVAIEAMSCGTVVVALNEGGYKETVINNQTGFLINYDEKELINKINILTSDINLLKSFSEKSLYEARKWNWDKHIDNIVKIFNAFLRENTTIYEKI